MKLSDNLLIKLEPIFIILEDKFIKYFISIIVFALIINKTLIVNDWSFAIDSLDCYITNNIHSILKDKDGTLITLSAVFIGIYFTLFTLLSSLKTDSTFSLLNQDNFERLLNHIRNAFAGSFLYLFYSLFSPIIPSEWIKAIISLSLLLYMLLSALRFGIVIYFIFSIDIKKYREGLASEKQKQSRIDNLIHRLEKFLDNHDDAENIKKSAEISEMLKKKQDKN